MKKLLAHLEKQPSTWFVLGISVLFFFLRLPSLFEPYWYGDEGIYETLGLGINQGRVLYQEIWDNKPPLLYYIYALAHANQELVRLFSLVCGIATIVVFFFLTRLLFAKEVKKQYIATSLFAILFGLPLLEGTIANAENFILLPVTVGMYLLLHTLEKKKKDLPFSFLFLLGIIFGIAFLLKVVALFDFLSCVTLLFFLLVRTPLFSEKNLLLVKKLIFLGISFTVPLGLVCLFFAFHHALGTFVHSAFLSNIGYVNYGNTFFIPQGFLILKAAVLGGVLLFIYQKRTTLSSSQLFLSLWISFSVFNALFSQRPYTHYLLVLLPSFCLGIGYILFNKTIRPLASTCLLIILLYILNYFSLSNKTQGYYQNFLSFSLGQKSTQAYQAFFDGNTPRDYAVVAYLKPKLRPTDTVFLWGNSAQIYPLLNTLPSGRFTVAYHIRSNDQTREETKQVLEKNLPTYIIVLPNEGPLPIELTNYHVKTFITDTTIYERTF